MLEKNSQNYKRFKQIETKGNKLANLSNGLLKVHYNKGASISLKI